MTDQSGPGLRGPGRRSVSQREKTARRFGKTLITQYIPYTTRAAFSFYQGLISSPRNTETSRSNIVILPYAQQVRIVLVKGFLTI